MSVTRYCTAANPMPENRDFLGDHWVHEGAQSTGECSDRRFAYYRCKDCGHTWSQEVAQ